VQPEHTNKLAPADRAEALHPPSALRPSQSIPESILALQQTAGNQAVAAMFGDMSNGVQRLVVDGYDRWVEKPLSRGVLDWEITDRECLRVISTLESLSDGDLLDTYNQMQSDGLWSELVRQAPTSKQSWTDLRWRLFRLGQPVLEGNNASAEDKRLARLKSALSASERGFEAAGALIEHPAWRQRMRDASQGFGLAADALERGLELEAASKAIYKFSRAAATFQQVDLRSDEGAEAVAELFESFDEISEWLPGNIWTYPLSVIGSLSGVVRMVRQAGKPMQRASDGRFDWLDSFVDN
jgi:hypothetical protein